MEQIDDTAKVCKHCNSAIVKKCPFCAEEINVQAKKCKFCNSDLTSPTGEPKAAPGGAARLNNNPIGEERSPIVVLIVTLFTCGLAWMFYYMFAIAGDINRHSGQQKLNPGLDVVLCLVTCGIWFWVVAYKYSKAIYEMEVEEGVPGANDQSAMCLILAIFVGIAVPLILQGELNKHWQLHRGGAAR
jgi:hypothetical protein